MSQFAIGLLSIFATLVTTLVSPVRAESSLALDSVVHFKDFQNREPMLLELGNGDLLVSGFPRRPHEPARAPSLWRSSDGGKSWSRVNVGTPADGAIGNSDVDLAIAPDGTVYFVTMGFNRTTNQGTHVAVGVSEDHAASWVWTQLTDRELADRPWVAVAPDGTAHVVWNDGEGVHHKLSRDGGGSWQSMPQVHPAGGSSHFAVGPEGELAVRITP
ncbi:MAG: sialidase family protein, partial [Pseudomonadota bacterium]